MSWPARSRWTPSSFASRTGFTKGTIYAPRQIRSCPRCGSKKPHAPEPRRSAGSGGRLCLLQLKAPAKKESGMALVIHSCGSNPAGISEAEVTIDGAGRISLFSGTADQGSEQQTTLRQMVAEVLGVSLDDVGGCNADTSTCPFDSGPFSSRTVYATGIAASRAAEEVKKKLLERASRFAGRRRSAISTSERSRFGYERIPPNELIWVNSRVSPAAPSAAREFITPRKIVCSPTASRRHSRKSKSMSKRARSRSSGWCHPTTWVAPSIR